MAGNGLLICCNLSHRRLLIHLDKSVCQLLSKWQKSPSKPTTHAVTMTLYVTQNYFYLNICLGLIFASRLHARTFLTLLALLQEARAQLTNQQQCSIEHEIFSFQLPRELRKQVAVDENAKVWRMIMQKTSSYIFYAWTSFHLAFGYWNT